MATTTTTGEIQDTTNTSTTQILKEYGPRIASQLTQKLTAPPSLEDLDQILKNTNQLLFKACRAVDNKQDFEDLFKKLIGTSQEISSMTVAWGKTLGQVREYYQDSANDENDNNARLTLGKVFVARQAQVQRPSHETHEFWKKYQAALKGSKADDEVEVVADEDGANDEEARFTCPISKSIMKNPVRNKLCNHAYDESSINQILAKGGNTKCPVRGCGQPVIRANLTLDDVLQIDIEEWHTKQTKRQQKHQGKKKRGVTETTTSEFAEVASKSAATSSKKKKKVAVSDDEEEDVDEE
jgi:hypothetical protein